MDGVNRNRIRWGAIAWLLTLQFFVVEAIAQSRFAGDYSRTDDVISTLGTAESAARQLMNASFVVQGALIVAGALLLRPLLLRSAGQVAPFLLGAAGIGVLIVGAFPSDGSSGLHATGAVLYLAGGGLGLIALAYALRPRSEALGTTLALLGLIGTAATVFFLAGVTRFLGEGGTERAAAYVLPLGLALTGAALWRLGAGSDGGEGLSRREERELARARRAEQDRERDEALEAAARRSAASRPAGGDAPHPGADDSEPEDPWAAPPRRRTD
jgi:hypothetical membrane protein